MQSFRLLILFLIPIVACGSNRADPLPRMAHVDLSRFMGDWYVIAHIPSYLEREAYDAVESYELRRDGKVQTSFRFRKGSFDAPMKTMHPLGTVHEGSGNAVWGMRFIWPIQAEYVIAYVDQDYQQTIIGRSKRDYVWLMARTPQISDIDYAVQVDRIRALGYDTGKLRRVPQASVTRDEK